MKNKQSVKIQHIISKKTNDKIEKQTNHHTMTKIEPPTTQLLPKPK